MTVTFYSFVNILTHLTLRVCICNTCEGKLSDLAKRSLNSLGFGHSRRFGVAKKARADHDAAADAAGVLAVHPSIPLRECLKKMADAGRRPQSLVFTCTLMWHCAAFEYTSPLCLSITYVYMYFLADSGAHAVAVVSETGYLY